LSKIIVILDTIWEDLPKVVTQKLEMVGTSLKLWHAMSNLATFIEFQAVALAIFK